MELKKKITYKGTAFGIIPFDVINVKVANKVAGFRDAYAFPGRKTFGGMLHLRIHVFHCGTIEKWHGAGRQYNMFSVWKSNMTDVFPAVLMLQHTHE